MLPSRPFPPLDANAVLADLDAAADYAKQIPAANGTIAPVGFCWAEASPSPSPLTAKTSPPPLCFYGSAPSDVSTITAPV